jgi:hypothetical protein
MNHLLDFFAPLARERAYLDPGSGSILLQLVIAAALGAAFAVKVYWKKIKGAFSKNKDGVDPSSPDASADNDPDNES